MKIQLNRNVLFTIIGFKGILLLIIYFAYTLLPFYTPSYFGNFHYPSNESISLQSAYKTWDAQHYLYLSQVGYAKLTESIRFYPLFPLILRFFQYMIPYPVIAGIVAANILSTAGFYYFYLLGKKILGDEKKAFFSLLIFLCFPTAFYFSLIYSESLFLFLVCGFFYYLYSKKYLTASFIVFFIPLSRPVGIFILLPFFIYFFTYIYPLHAGLKTDMLPVLRKKETYLLIVPLMGCLFYFLFMQVATGSFYNGFRADSAVVGEWGIKNIFNPSIFFSNFFSPHLVLHGFLNSFTDRAFFVFYLCMLYLIYKKFDKTLFFYSLLMGFVPIFGSFMSYTRYILLVFPLFLVLGSILGKKENTYVIIVILYFFLSLQTLFLIMHALNYWVA